MVSIDRHWYWKKALLHTLCNLSRNLLWHNFGIPQLRNKLLCEHLLYMTYYDWSIDWLFPILSTHTFTVKSISFKTFLTNTWNSFRCVSTCRVLMTRVIVTGKWSWKLEECKDLLTYHKDNIKCFIFIYVNKLADSCKASSCDIGWSFDTVAWAPIVNEQVSVISRKLITTNNKIYAVLRRKCTFVQRLVIKYESQSENMFILSLCVRFS